MENPCDPIMSSFFVFHFVVGSWKQALLTVRSKCLRVHPSGSIHKSWGARCWVQNLNFSGQSWE